MRRRVGLWLLISAVAAVAAATGLAAARNVAITSLAASVTQGGTLHIDVIAVGGPTCSMSVRYANGRVQALGKKSTYVYRVSWTWRVPATAAPGSAHVVLECGSAGQGAGSFIVRKRRALADVVAVKSGLTQTPHAADTGTDVSYGIVLVNRSLDVDALDVQVGVNVLDRGKHVVGSVPTTIAAIPAGGTYYLGGDVTTRDRTAVAAVQSIVRVGASRPKSIVAPVLSDIRVSQDGSGGGAYIDGQLSNDANGTLSARAAISAVFFDSAGAVIGGGSTVPPFPLAPGASAAFEIVTPVAASAIASVRGSVEPRLGS